MMQKQVNLFELHKTTLWLKILRLQAIPRKVLDPDIGDVYNGLRIMSTDFYRGDAL